MPLEIKGTRTLFSLLVGCMSAVGRSALVRLGGDVGLSLSRPLGLSLPGVSVALL